MFNTKKYCLPLHGDILFLSAFFSSPGNATEPTGAWTPWLATSISTQTSPAPPNASELQDELATFKSIQQNANAAQLDRARYWNAGAANYRWLKLMLDRYVKGPPSAMKGCGLALLNVAIYDAVVTATQAKEQWNIERPQLQAQQQIVPGTGSYPSARAAAAGAAADVLEYLFPDDKQDFSALADEAGQARVLAGYNYPSDIDAGLQLGKQVAAQIIAYAKTDKSDSVFDGLRPTGADKYQADKLIGAALKLWQPWVISSPADYLPVPPPAIDSPEFKAELEELKTLERTVPVS